MKKVVKDLPVVNNVCRQILREVERNKNFSVAHVIMQPLGESLLHKHKKLVEIYVITSGYGELLVDGMAYQVTAGSVILIPRNSYHMLINRGLNMLEHLVIACPPFNENDVKVLSEPAIAALSGPVRFATEIDAVDGAKIMAYDFSKPYNLSIAFGRVTNNPTRKKEAHYHRASTEYVYIVSGQGFINNASKQPVKAGEWLEIRRCLYHGFINEAAEDMIMVCICCPAFNQADVYYHT